MPGFEFNLGAANLGPTAEEAKPSAVVQVNRVLLVREHQGQPSALLVDASVVNPASGSRKARKTTASR